MDINIEMKFVKNFIKKDFQQKILLALRNPQKRKDILMRFSHNAILYLKQNLICISGAKISRQECLYEICRLTKEKSWRYLDCDNIEGVDLSLAEALDKSYGQYGFSLCLSESVVFIKEETEKGPPQKYILAL